MLKCRCGIAYPVFVQECKTCGKALDSNPANAEQLQKYSVMKELSAKRMVQGDTTHSLMFDILSGRAPPAKPPKPANVPWGDNRRQPGPPPDKHKAARAFDREISMTIIRECESFYRRYASRIGDQFTSEDLADYIAKYLDADAGSREIESRADDLIDMLHGFAGFEAEEDKQAKQPKRDFNPRNPKDV